MNRSLLIWNTSKPFSKVVRTRYIVSGLEEFKQIRRYLYPQYILHALYFILLHQFYLISNTNHINSGFFNLFTSHLDSLPPTSFHRSPIICLLPVSSNFFYKFFDAMTLSFRLQFLLNQKNAEQNVDYIDAL